MMNWILFGVIIVLAHSSRHKFSNPMFRNVITVDASPIPPNGPFLKSMNPYIRHWEAARFDITALKLAKQEYDSKRQKREANDTLHQLGARNTIRLQFFAHNRDFRIILHENPTSIFSPNVIIESTTGPLNYDLSRVYTGTLEDNDNAIVHGVLTENSLFDGSIITPSESYYIEPASRYSVDLNDKGIHSIVYKTSDVEMLPHQQQFTYTFPSKEGDLGRHYCASEILHEKLKNDKKLLWNAANDDFSPIEAGKTRRKDTIYGKQRHHYEYSTRRNKRWLPDQIENQDPPLPLDLDVPYNEDYSIFSRKYNTQNENRKNILINTYNTKSDLVLRNTSKTQVNQNENSTTDFNLTHSKPSHKTHVEIITKNGATKKPNIIGSNYNPDIILTRNNFHHHHQPLSFNNNIRTNTVGDGKSMYDRKSTCMLYLQADHTFYQKMGSEEASIEAITRHVQRANTIYKNTDFNGDGKPDNITFMIKRIKIHTSYALKDTNYRFPGNYGVEKFLELFSEEDYDAFCLAYMFTYRDFEMGTLGLAWTGDLKNAGGVCEKNGHYRGSLKSLNTGIVTLLNYGKHVPPAVSHVTLAHEIGHNFGSPHDPEQCTPGGEDGNYIMFARATSGDKKNNNKFSPCSLKAIEPVLNAKARSNKGCFTEPQEAICGNGVVDPGEECDCGWEEDCKDSCCFPMSSHPVPDEKPCTLTPRAMCSPSQGPCCTASCSLKFGDKCRDDNGCRDPSFCDGHSPQCPLSINKPNKSVCNKEFVCYMGECTGSICLAYGLESCQCIPSDDDPKTKACELCCKLPGEGSECKSSFEWNEKPYDVPDMYSKPGTPCNEYNGYCDVFQKCRDVDPSGPLATLRRLLLSEESIESFKKWIISNWFAVAFVVFAVIILLILSVKLFGKEMDRKLKSLTIIHSPTTETVRLPDDSNEVIVHTAVRTKVPFKKKVRGERRHKASKLKTNKTNSTIKGLVSSTVIPTSSKTKKVKRHVTSKDERAAKGPKKSGTKKKPVDSMDVEELAPTSASDNIKTRNSQAKTKSTPKHSEVIDYSMDSSKLSAFGKVHQWLLESQSTKIPTPSQELEDLPTKTRQINKSQSTPSGLTQRPPKKVKSVSNLNDKVKLQVVYKPPFKLSLKLSKNSAVKTKVINTNVVDSTRNQRNGRIDKTRKVRGVNNDKSHRAALLIRSKDGNDTDKGLLFNLKVNRNSPEDRQQLMPTEPKRESSNLQAEQLPNENSTSNTGECGLNNKHTFNHAPIDTGTYRINKPASGSNSKTNVPTLNETDFPIKRKDSKSSRRESSANSAIVGSLNIDNMKIGENHSNVSSSGGSTSNLNKEFISSNKLMRSSTTNLSKNRSNCNSFDKKHRYDNIKRSSTTNLSKDRHHGSQLSLLKHQQLRGSISIEDVTLPSSFCSTSGTSGTNKPRRNNSTIQCSEPTIKTNTPCAQGNSKLKIGLLEHSNLSNNIPRASLNLDLPVKHSNITSQENREIS